MSEPRFIGGPKDGMVVPDVFRNDPCVLFDLEPPYLAPEAWRSILARDPKATRPPPCKVARYVAGKDGNFYHEGVAG